MSAMEVCLVCGVPKPCAYEQLVTAANNVRAAMDPENVTGGGVPTGEQPAITRQVSTPSADDPGAAERPCAQEGSIGPCPSHQPKETQQ